MTAAYCARVHFTEQSSYARVQLRTEKIFLLASFCEKNERKPEKTCIIAVKCRRDCHLANQEGCFSLLKPCFPSWNRFLLQVPVKFTKMKKNLYRPVYRFFLSGQNSDRFQDRPVKTGNRTCNRFLDRTECRGQFIASYVTIHTVDIPELGR